METKKVFEYALQREYEGKRFFLENADRLHHAAATQAFRQLAEEEQRHIEFIQFQLDALNDPTNSDKGKELGGRAAGFFQERYNVEAIDQTVLEAMVPDLPVLRMAYLIERDFAEFYEQAAQTTEGEAKEALLMLSQWERGHERYFKDLHDRSFESYSQMPWGG